MRVEDIKETVCEAPKEEQDGDCNMSERVSSLRITNDRDQHTKATWKQRLLERKTCAFTNSFVIDNNFTLVHDGVR